MHYFARRKTVEMIESTDSMFNNTSRDVAYGTYVTPRLSGISWHATIMHKKAIPICRRTCRASKKLCSSQHVRECQKRTRSNR